MNTFPLRQVGGSAVCFSFHLGPGQKDTERVLQQRLEGKEMEEEGENW